MDFWQQHGILFLLGCALFPRITLLFFSGVTFGFWIIVGWLFVPHVTVAILASMLYWDTNPILVIIAWIVALVGTGSESKSLSKVKK